MVHARVSEEMPASCEAVFDLVHDYTRRLEWDTLLREAFVEGGAPAGHGAIAVCSGRWLIGGLTLRTVYVSFERGEVAAVKMINAPPLFASWAASIRHEPLGEARSLITYTYNFRAKPRWLAWLLEPILAIVFRWETGRRLRALQRELLRSGRQ
ncbi:MAG: SRPBCC family protein [Deltaproteobacteria bacterium]|nr:SRPBCC family protein [Nannocystaceae bacterium]